MLSAWLGVTVATAKCEISLQGHSQEFGVRGSWQTVNFLLLAPLKSTEE